MDKTYTETEVIELFKSFLKYNLGSEGWVHINGNPDYFVNEFKEFIDSKETK